MCTMILCLFCVFMMGQTGDRTIYFNLIIDSTPVSKPLPELITMSYVPYEIRPWHQRITKKDPNRNIEWIIPSNEPINLYLSLPIANSFKSWVLEPGDSIIVNYKDERVRFSGKGADKLILNNEIATLKEALQKPSNPTFYVTNSVQDYIEWREYLNRELALIELLIESSKEKLNSFSFNYLKLTAIEDYEDRLRHKFMNLRLEELHVDKKTLCKIFDEDFFTPKLLWFRSQPTAWIGEHVITGFNRLFLARQNNFPPDHRGALVSKEEFALAMFNNGKNIYKGDALEYGLMEFLTSYVIKEFGFSPVTETLLHKYYSDPERKPEFQAYVKNFEQNTRMVTKNERVPDFTVYDAQLKPITRSGLMGKVVLMHFWKAGDPASARLANSLKKVETLFRDNPNVTFLHISADKDRSAWLKNLSKSTYTTGMGINAYVDQKDGQDNILDSFNIKEFPAVILVNYNGKVISNSLVDSFSVNDKLIGLIRKHALKAAVEDWQGGSDGPYILHETSGSKSYTFEKGVMAVKAMQEENNKPVLVATDEPGKKFTVKLKVNTFIEPSVFPRPEKLIAFSDIEGNFDALRMLLQNNKVIDAQFNWTFGKGHLVFAGDMFDRGEQVTECLWLLYSLEEKARKEGGYVHFILGNHELMNLDKNHKYARSKYKENATKMGKTLAEIYGNNSELGKWLRTKNIVEKIGDILFMHAGLSQEVNDLGLTIEQINELARPYYDNASAAKQSSDRRLALLFDNELSPFWYRNYYKEKPVVFGLARNKQVAEYRTPVNVIDEILTHYQVNKIVTGHTIFEGVKEGDIGKNLTVHYNGKVINTDTKHASGHTEALLIVGDTYYKVNKMGERQELFSSIPVRNNIVLK